MTFVLYRSLVRATTGTNALASLIDSRLLRPISTRNFSDSKPESPPPNSGKDSVSDKIKTSREQVRQNVNKIIFTRYIDRVQNYENVLEKNFPSAVKVYRVFFDGLKLFYNDMKRFLKITRIANGSPNGLKALNRRELELYMQMPRDMLKVAPAIILSSLPMVGYAAFPVAYMYPRIFLTHHFWTLQQKSEFQKYYLTERLGYNRQVFRCLQAKLKSVQKDPLYPQLDTIFGLIGSGFHPTTENLLEVKDLFAKSPFSYESLSGKHIKNLIQMHGLRTGFGKRIRLYEHAFMVHTMDLAITREGGVHNMPIESLKYACFIRGLNPVNMSNEKMVEWLRQWVEISLAIEEDHISLFLHLPIFLGYNHPSNWQLVYGKSKTSPVDNC